MGQLHQKFDVVRSKMMIELCFYAGFFLILYNDPSRVFTPDFYLESVDKPDTNVEFLKKMMEDENYVLQTAIQHFPQSGSFNEYCRLPSLVNDRYKHLKDRKFFLAINLHNSEEILPQMIANLLLFTQYLAPGNLFISIFESGSNDNTKDMLREFGILLNATKTPYRIVDSPLRKSDQMNRIEYLVYVRNWAMDPLYELVKQKTNLTGHYDDEQPYDSVIFINDIFFCIDDLLELEFQRVLNNASMSAGLDYQHGWSGPIQFYDKYFSLI